MTLVNLWGRWRRQLTAENIAAAALIFRLAGPFDRINVETGIFNLKQFWILRGRTRIGSDDRAVVVKIEKPDTASGQQEKDKHNKLFLLLHAAVLK